MSALITAPTACNIAAALCPPPPPRQCLLGCTARGSATHCVQQGVVQMGGNRLPAANAQATALQLGALATIQLAT